VDPEEALLSNLVIDGIIRSSAAGGIEVAIPAPGEAA
jgi:hypothetical protein